MLKTTTVSGTKGAGNFFFWLLLLVAILPMFWQLGTIPIYAWDESRLAVNAAEMSDNGNLIVTHHRGVPDMWNTKPPFMIWLQAACMKLFGYNVIAVRIPSALAGAGTVLLLFFFGRKITGSGWAGILAAFVLVTIPGYMDHHVVRTGDYDALLIFFLIAYFMLFFLYLEQPRKKYLILFTLALTLAVLTKGIAGLIPAPALVIYALYRKKLVWLLTQKETYFAVAAFVAVIGGYYVAREAMNPGYWAAVMENELGGRYLTTLENHDLPAGYYFEKFLEWRLTPWVFLFPAAACLNLLSKNQLVCRFTVLALLYIGLQLLIISTAQTKLGWYDAPVFPMIALITGLALFLLLETLWRHFGSSKKQLLFYSLTLILLFSLPYYRILRKYLKEKSESYASHPGIYFGPAIKDLRQKAPEVTTIHLLKYSDNHPQLDFYKYVYAREGISLVEVHHENIDNLAAGSYVAVCDPPLREELLQKYETENLYWFHTCGNFKILGRK